MRRGELVFGLLATPDGRGGPEDDKYRDLSIAWSRYGYRDAIVEGESVDAILSEAAARGHRYCLILAPGILIRESWRGDADAGRDFHSSLADWIDKSEFLVVGRILDGKAEHSLLLELFTKEGAGTMVTTREEEKRYLDE